MKEEVLSYIDGSIAHIVINRPAEKKAVDAVYVDLLPTVLKHVLCSFEFTGGVYKPRKNDLFE